MNGSAMPPNCRRTPALLRSTFLQLGLQTSGVNQGHSNQGGSGAIGEGQNLGEMRNNKCEITTEEVPSLQKG